MPHLENHSFVTEEVNLCQSHHQAFPELCRRSDSRASGAIAEPRMFTTMAFVSVAPRCNDTRTCIARSVGNENLADVRIYEDQNHQKINQSKIR
jgi:hypothetical protein